MYSPRISLRVVTKIGRCLIKRFYNLLNLIDIDRSDLRSHLYEIKFLNSIGDINNNELNELSEFIQNDAEIVPERVQELNKNFPKLPKNFNNCYCNTTYGTLWFY